MVNVSMQKGLFLTRWQLASMYFLLIKAEVGGKRNCDRIAIETTIKQPKEAISSPVNVLSTSKCWESDFGF